MRTLSLLVTGTVACLLLAACGDSGSKMTKVEPRPAPTETIPSPTHEFNQKHKMDSTTGVQPPAGKRKQN